VRRSIKLNQSISPEVFKFKPPIPGPKKASQ
jgi:outer membrane lipoprotein-sorting protein